MSTESDQTINWRSNLTLVWICQFLSIMGFGFGLPFAPYFMQEMGVDDPTELNFWIAMFGSAAPLSLALFSPIWGTVADRYGRRPMLLRAYLGASLVVLLMGCATEPYQLVILRALQGMLTGTVTASQTLVSANTPENRTGLALGTLSAAVFSGAMAGMALGGICAEHLGYRMSFYIAGWLLALAALITVVGVKENFVRPKERASLASFKVGYGKLTVALPILVLMLLMALTRQFDNSFLPMMIQTLNGGLKGASFWTGIIGATSGCAGLLAGIIMGHLADRVSPPRLAQCCALAAAMMIFPIYAATGFLYLGAFRFGALFFAGGLDPVFQIWLAKITPRKSRGVIFGWAATAKSAGWMCAPMTSAFIASYWSVRSIYLVEGCLYLVLIALIGVVVSKVMAARKQETDVGP